MVNRNIASIGTILFIVFETVLSQCIPANNVCGPVATIANRGVPLIFPSAPIEVSISSDDLFIDGCLDIKGTLPFYSAVAVEGTVPNCGEASALYECGNGKVGIEAPLNVAKGSTLGFPGLGLRSECV